MIKVLFHSIYLLLILSYLGFSQNQSNKNKIKFIEKYLQLGINNPFKIIPFFYNNLFLSFTELTNKENYISKIILYKKNEVVSEFFYTYDLNNKKVNSIIEVIHNKKDITTLSKLYKKTNIQPITVNNEKKNIIGNIFYFQYHEDKKLKNYQLFISSLKNIILNYTYTYNKKTSYLLKIQSNINNNYTFFFKEIANNNKISTKQKTNIRNSKALEKLFKEYNARKKYYSMVIDSNPIYSLLDSKIVMNYNNQSIRILNLFFNPITFFNVKERSSFKKIYNYSFKYDITNFISEIDIHVMNQKGSIKQSNNYFFKKNYNNPILKEINVYDEKKKKSKPIYELEIIYNQNLPQEIKKLGISPEKILLFKSAEKNLAETEEEIL